MNKKEFYHGVSLRFNNFLLVILLLCVMVSGVFAQAVKDSSSNVNGDQLSLKRVVILSSGLAYYEHSGSLNGNAKIPLQFRPNAINDALKSLVVNDPVSKNPSVSYQSEQTLFQTLRSLKINLYDNPSLANILEGLKGAEVSITAPSPLKGRIIGVEYRSALQSSFSEAIEPRLLLNTDEGLKLFSLKEINSISFTDPEIERDLNRALDLISASRNSFSRQLTLDLPGSGKRDVSISYIIPSPVWKVSYRLDLGAAKPLFQGWAIVDNDSDSDWNNVELSLVAGRPVSFIQNLYPPYYVMRPTQPLSIAGTASAASHDEGYAFGGEKDTAEMPMPSAAPTMLKQSYAVEAEALYNYDTSRERAASITGGAINTAAGSDAGGQFEFTIKNRVSLDRRMSAMFPIVESEIGARKLIIYNGGSHPRLGAELTNTSKMKLPAGAVTVYDGGVYAGDALLEFWNEDEKKFISFGEDLSVSVMISDSNARAVSSVTVAGGVMTINRSLSFNKAYTFKNSSAVSKRLLVEHQKTPNTELVSPSADEQTASVYRFSMTLPENRELILSVSEQRPISESITLLSLRHDIFLTYTTNQEIPSRVRDALKRAVDLRQAADAADVAVKDLEAQKMRLSSDQDRIRRNLEVAGNQTQQGQEYLKRLVALDGEIDALAPALDKAYSNAKNAREAWENYLKGLNL